ncbi:DUF3325 domain-containing protein [Pseudomonas sp. 21LCFQ02]|uniref:DUF3325 domain-containing protein n=1 Tax=unclassified Pseudomonas TaxID=196821 RepID=UPI0004F68A26|nr:MULTISPECIES: DUF3325 domain-containing protein [unclassified Pseudomonas]MCO8168149.1 DUF3325 domain-containing protein [Pseudomonas sp. 21LCFQ02]MCQ9426381.1 DUF3325 domain-containing protein [Pseudomonas sp. LJDD11]BAP41448.1 putative uncharacterized protein [Pseudomonas sp. StFLB209]
MLLPALLCYSGFTALCLSMERHYSDLLAGKPSMQRRRGLKITGWLLLVVAGWLAVATRGWAMGLVEWTAALMGSAVLLVFLMPYKPRWILPLASAGLLVAAALAAILVT